MQAAAERDFRRITWSVFFGKLVKQAQGLEYTHAKTHPVDFGKLADWCGEAGALLNMTRRFGEPTRPDRCWPCLSRMRPVRR